MATLSTHVLDTAAGLPAAGVEVTLIDGAGDVLDSAETDEDGRVAGLGGDLAPGIYTLQFATGDYYDGASFHPRVTIEFTVGDDPHYHVPLLLSPFGYTTYRGS